MNYGIIMNLQLFTDGGEGGNGEPGAGASGGKGTGATYSYEQAEEIADSRAERASKAALSSYFRQQGMSEAEVAEAIKDFKEKKEAGKPDVAALTKERDDALRELNGLKNRSVLSGLNVAPDFVEFVESKVSAMVTAKKDFETCAKEYLAENKQYIKSTNTYRMSSGAAAGNQGGDSDPNSDMNARLRRAFGKM